MSGRAPISHAFGQLAADRAGRGAFGFAKGAIGAQHGGAGRADPGAARTIPNPSLTARSGPPAGPLLCADRRGAAHGTPHAAAGFGIRFLSRGVALDSGEKTTHTGGSSTCANFPFFSLFSPRPLRWPAAWKLRASARSRAARPAPSSPMRRTRTSSRGLRSALLRAARAATRASARPATEPLSGAQTGAPARHFGPLRGPSYDAIGAARPGGIRIFGTLISNHEERAGCCLRPMGRD